MRFIDRCRRVLGMNRRNLELIMKGNPRDKRLVVDDKLVCKEILDHAGIPVPPNLCMVSNRKDIKPALDQIDDEGQAAIKPARGLGGQGLMIVRRYDPQAIRFHLAAILNGAFSAQGNEDRAVIEPLLVDTPRLWAIHGGAGLSDLRIIAAKGVPLMAMLRLPCRESGGAANLHAGGLGVGVDMATGITTHGISHGRQVTSHPDTGRPLAGYQVPYWSQCCDIAGQMNQLFSLAYIGLDLVVDRERGLMVLEVNARPGLAVQLANGHGLREVIAGEVSDA